MMYNSASFRARELLFCTPGVIVYMLFCELVPLYSSPSLSKTTRCLKTRTNPEAVHPVMSADARSFWDACNQLVENVMARPCSSKDPSELIACAYIDMNPTSVQIFNCNGVGLALLSPTRDPLDRQTFCYDEDPTNMPQSASEQTLTCKGRCQKMGQKCSIFLRSSATLCSQNANSITFYGPFSKHFRFSLCSRFLELGTVLNC
jgi:hypothetical protein